MIYSNMIKNSERLPEKTKVEMVTLIVLNDLVQL